MPLYSSVGFKQGFSTQLCTGLIKNVIARYNSNDSHVYGCFLDASKAFDRVNHSILFQKLLQRNLSPVITRALLSWYSHQRVRVSWNQKLSTEFSVSNGVRQGGVLSPILFTIYINDLLAELEELGVGCYWNECIYLQCKTLGANSQNCNIAQSQFYQTKTSCRP